MVNVILKFTENRKKKGQMMGFDNKKVHFVCNDSKFSVKEGEIWECFLWSEQSKYNLVKPFKQIDPNNVREEVKRVEQFNKEILLLERKIGPEFTKVVFDERNKPYLLSTMTLKQTRDKYPTFIVKKYKERIYARPIITPDDRVEWRESQVL